LFHAVALALVLAQNPTSRAVTLDGGLVTAQIPSTWVEISRTRHAQGEVVAFQIPNPADEGTPDSANAVIFTRHDAALTMDHFVAALRDPIVKLPGSAVIESAVGSDPSSDRFLFLRARQGTTPYAMADRYARRGEVFLHIRVSWPLLERATRSWTEEIVHSTNQLFSNLQFKGKPLGHVSELRLGTLK
jgi:hypothetical protein